MNSNTYIVNYGYHNLYIMTDLKCKFCDGCGTIKYEVIHISMKNRDILR